jgi:glutamyl-tRNA(Gln) amidotransferase subunit D
LAGRIAEKVRKGVRGVVVTHGTDTMGYSAAALSFALLGCPVPVILVGAQRSSDRPSSDAATNLIGAVLAAARADFSGVYVAMHDGIGDDTIALHLGTRVRKNHTSRRDAFESVNGRVAAIVKGAVITRKTEGLPPRGQNGSFKPGASFEKKVALVKFHPEFDPAVLNYYVSKGFRGIVLEGTGLGHLSSSCHQAVKEAVDRGVLVTMTSQCIWGRVRLTVYDTGRDLLSAGVIPLDDMLSETALVKAMWAIANSTSVAEAAGLTRHNLAGECRPRRLIS